MASGLGMVTVEQLSDESAAVQGDAPRGYW